LNIKAVIAQIGLFLNLDFKSILNTNFNNLAQKDYDNYNELKGFVDTVDERVSTIITTPIEGEAAAQELIDARGGEATLGDRLDGYDTHLAGTVTNIVNLVTGFGADPLGVLDASLAMQSAVDSLPSDGGIIYCPGKFLVGDVIVDKEHVTFVGRGTQDQIIAKSGTTAVTVKQHFVSCRDITIKNQGNKTDGLGTRGFYYAKTPISSIGFSEWHNVNIIGFGLEGGLTVINPIQFTYNFAYLVSCGKAVIFDRDAENLSFGTTVTMNDIYVSSCIRGIDARKLYRSSFKIVAEYCDYGIYLNACAITLYRCYFEGNFIKGCYAIDSEVQDLYSYSNNLDTDGVEVTFTGLIPAADRGYVRDNKSDVLAKRVGLLSNYGTDPKYFSAFGNNNNVGLKYGEAIVPIIRGDNSLNPAAWVSNRSAEFQGWDFANQGYKIAGTTAGDNTYGMKQDITLDNTKQYVIDLASTTIAGSGITSIKCGSLTVTNGVPFTPPANGVNTVKAYGLDATGTPFECYVHAFVISEVFPQEKYTAIAQNKLTSKQRGRGVTYGAAAPTTGYWAKNEIVLNSAPTAGGYIGWVCITAGSPGTWKGYGLIQV
jgi:hypothetical protein